MHSKQLYRLGLSRSANVGTVDNSTIILWKSVRGPADLRDFSGVGVLHSDNRGDFQTQTNAAGCGAAVSRIWIPNRSGVVYHRRGGDTRGAFDLSDGDNVAGFHHHRNGHSGLFHLAKSRCAIARARRIARSHGG